MEKVFLVFMVFVVVICIFALMIVIRDVVKEISKPKPKRKKQTRNRLDEEE